MKKKRPKKRRNKIKIYLFILFLLIIIISILNIILPKYFNPKNQKQEPATTKENIKQTEYSLSLVMVGDALIHDKIYKEALNNTNGITYDFTPMLEQIKPIIQTHDIAYYNQETILGGSEIGLSSYPAFNSPYEVGDAMIDTGFNLVSLATNHTLDRGEKAIINSRNYWNSKTEILAVGSYSSQEEKNKIHILEKNNITYTILNYTYGTNGIKVPSGKEYLVNLWPVTGTIPDQDTTYQKYKEQVKNEIESIRDKVDILLVAMHWGIEYQTTPNDYQKDMANYLESLGVDIIIGTHPHVIQPITWINDTLVIYSLGNFISAHEVVNISNRVGLMTSIEITKTENENTGITIQLKNLENELLYTNYTKDYKNFLVIPFSNITEEILPNYKEVYQIHKNILQSLDKTIVLNPITEP